MEERKVWYECPKAKCGSIFPGDTPCCPACGTESPRELHLTPKEVVLRVWPNWRKIWTRQPSQFDEPIAEVRKEMAEALA